MDDYSSLAALISSSILVVTSVAYFFGRFGPKIEKGGWDKEAYIMDGFWFLMNYSMEPIVGIGFFEIIQNKGTYLISIILTSVLIVQALCMYLGIKLMWNTKDVEVFCQSNKYIKIIHSCLIWLLTTISKWLNYSKKESIRHIIIFLETMSLYAYIKIYLSRHIGLVNLNIPQTYRMETYIILSSMLTFMSLMVVRLFDAKDYLEAHKERVYLRINESDE